MVPSKEKQEKIEEFVKRVRAAVGPNIESIVLFGSAVAGDFHPGLSNLNLLCVLRDSSFTALQPLAPVAKWWDSQRQPPPLCMTRTELERSTDVFTIELLDMQQHHRLLLGEDVVQGLQISMHVHRVQVEYELREKLILLRHALIALGETPPPGRREAVDALSMRLGFDLSAIHRALDVREHDVREQKADRKKIDVNDLAARYLAAVEKVTAAVDEALDSEASGRA